MLSVVSAPACLELHVLRVADLVLTGNAIATLDAEEHLRAQRLIPEERASFLAAHVWLRQLLSARLGCQAEEIAFTREPCPCCGAAGGRPAVRHPPCSLHFSLSRSDGVVLIGIAAAPVGVDVEALPAEATATAVSELLHPAERAEITAAPAAIRAETFARIWTRKEAYLKGVGSGVAHDLAAACVGAEGPAPAGWHLVEVPVGAGYVAAAAVRTGG